MAIGTVRGPDVEGGYTLTSVSTVRDNPKLGKVGLLRTFSPEITHFSPPRIPLNPQLTTSRTGIVQEH
ncbi:hypothetical protein QR685DRAFT_452834 [Neurospora intermedia]|uniref:Uncharacterized protein n=1 Tax=Neurospora intermedia TaxID=5142 RepID=A0ABR3D0Z4_NEUIN